MKKLLTVLFILALTGASAIASPIGKWDHMPIKVYIEDNKNTYLMKKAFTAWEQSSNKLVRFEYINSPENADIPVYFVEKVEHGEHAVGLTTSQVKPDGTFIKAKIDIAKFSDLNTIKLSNFELLKIMKHEVGHAIGLPHSSNPNGIMNPTTNKVLDISKDDIRDLQAIYGK